MNANCKLQAKPVIRLAVLPTTVILVHVLRINEKLKRSTLIVWTYVENSIKLEIRTPTSQLDPIGVHYIEVPL